MFGLLFSLCFISMLQLLGAFNANDPTATGDISLSKFGLRMPPAIFALSTMLASAALLTGFLVLIRRYSESASGLPKTNTAGAQYSKQIHSWLPAAAFPGYLTTRRAEYGLADQIIATFLGFAIVPAYIAFAVRYCFWIGAFSQMAVGWFFALAVYLVSIAAWLDCRSVFSGRSESWLRELAPAATMIRPLRMARDWLTEICLILVLAVSLLCATPG